VPVVSECVFIPMEMNERRYLRSTWAGGNAFGGVR